MYFLSLMCFKMYHKPKFSPLIIALLFFACGDIFQFQFNGVAIKLNLILLAFFYIFTFDYNKDFNSNKLLLFMFFAMFTILSLCSAIQNEGGARSLMFVIGNIMTFLTLFLFARLAEMNFDRILYSIILFFRISIITSLFLTISGVQPRASFIFYESSYYAVGLIPYLSAVFYLIFTSQFKKWILDALFILLILFLTSSFSLLIFIILVIFYYLLSFNLLSLKVVFNSLFKLFLVLFLLVHFNDRAGYIYDELMSHIGDLEYVFLLLLVQIGGHRAQTILLGWDVFFNNPLFGVGPGMFKNHSNISYSEDQFTLSGASSIDFSLDLDPSNMYLHLSSEIGIFALLIYFFILLWIYINSLRFSDNPVIKILLCAFIITNFAMLFNASYSRPYVYAIYGLLFGSLCKLTLTKKRS
jgi:hypothetical protein